MKKIRMCFPNEKTFREGFEEYILDCKARNLRDGTISHYQESIKQIYKRITPDALISSMCQQTMANFYISLRDDPNLNEVSMGTYARDLKTLMRFFIQAMRLRAQTAPYGGDAKKVTPTAPSSRSACSGATAVPTARTARCW